MYWDVTDIKVERNFTLKIKFSDGTCGYVRFKPGHFTGVFLPLKDPQFFARVFIDDGVVTWPGEIDIAPDAMYHEIKRHGEWTLC